LNLENEKVLLLLLGAHDTIERALKNFKENPHKDEESNDISSDVGPDNEQVDTDEKFQQEFIQNKLQDYGNPFNHFLIAQNTDSRSPYYSSSGTPIINNQPNYDPLYNKTVINTHPNTHPNTNQPFTPYAVPHNPFTGGGNPFSNNTPFNPSTNLISTPNPFANLNPTHINSTPNPPMANLTPYNSHSPFANPNTTLNLNSGLGGSLNSGLGSPLNSGLGGSLNSGFGGGLSVNPFLNAGQPNNNVQPQYNPQQQVFPTQQQQVRLPQTQQNQTGMLSNPFL